MTGTLGLPVSSALGAHSSMAGTINVTTLSLAHLIEVFHHAVYLQEAHHRLISMRWAKAYLAKFG